MSKRNEDEILKAIDGSIRKWEKIAFEGGIQRNYCDYEFALCRLFIDGDCWECPVVKYNQTFGCREYPFGSWAWHFDYQHPILLPFRQVVCSTCENLVKKQIKLLYKVKQWWIEKGEKHAL